MEYQNTDELIGKLSPQKSVESTKLLTEFYAKARFKMKSEDFPRQYTDGANDGGIDFYYREDTTFFIYQTKFSGIPKKVSSFEIDIEINKLKNTLTNENPNKKADDFVNSLKRETGNKNVILEILWLTTNIVEQSIVKEIQESLDRWRDNNDWLLGIEFVAIDKHTLESVIYDCKHGYIPYTGKKELKLEQGQWIETPWEETHVYSVICKINVNGILKWFKDSNDIDKFLQKNVREFLGEESKINDDIKRSYLNAPAWFWYKHNGIIIFADSLYIDNTNVKLVLRNPQVVNGGQTLKSLFYAYDKNNRNDNSAKVILRVYRLPYENIETYKRTIEIVSALNSQNNIKPSDLHSTDPRQIRLEQLFKEIGDYTYHRKRSKEAKSGQYSITMRNLALRYYVCNKNIPHEGVRGNIEELFEEDAKYTEVFNENAINKELFNNHIIFNYITCWNIDQVLLDARGHLPKEDAVYWKYKMVCFSRYLWKNGGMEAKGI